MSGWEGMVPVALLAAAAAAGLRWLASRRAAVARARLAEPALLRRLGALPGPRSPWLRGALLAGGVAALVGAARAGGPVPPTPRGEGVESVLVLDASNSMLAQDVEPDRLRRERALALEVLRRVPGDVGVVYFAGRGYVLSPLTGDRDAAAMFVESVRPASVGRGGSALRAGISQALGLLDAGAAGARKAVILFSDGEETVGESLEPALERARRAGIPIHAVGIGTPEGGWIPLGPDAAVEPFAGYPRGPLEGGYLRGPDGEVVVTRLEEETLQTIARETGGTYVRGERGAAETVVRRIAAESAPVPPRRAPAGPLLLVGFGLLWAEAFVFRRG